MIDTCTYDLYIILLELNYSRYNARYQYARGKLL